MRLAWASILVALSIASASQAVGGGDAGTGGDASDLRQAPTMIGLGAFGASYRPNDRDWFAVATAVQTPACLSFEHTSPLFSTVVFALETSRAIPYAVQHLQPGETGRGGIAVNERTTLHYGGMGAAAPYAFELTETRAGGLGDAGSGTDAGATPTTALPGEACTAGRLTGLLDPVDLFAWSFAKDDLVGYSLATASPDVRATLVDASGAALGPTIQSGEWAHAPIPQAGTYHLEVELVSGGTLDDASYVVGVVLNEPPTNPCRPGCVISENV